MREISSKAVLVLATVKGSEYYHTDALSGIEARVTNHTLVIGKAVVKLGVLLRHTGVA